MEKNHLPKQKIHEILVETFKMAAWYICMQYSCFGMFLVRLLYNLVYWYENQNQAGAWAVRMKKRVMFAASL